MQVKSLYANIAIRVIFLNDNIFKLIRLGMDKRSTIISVANYINKPSK